MNNSMSNLKNNTNFLLWGLATIATIYTFKFIILSQGLAINKYPFISQDGFDWITEGFWLSEYMKGNIYSNELPIARPFIFVFITTIDALLGQNGYVIGVVYGLAFYFMGAIGLKLINYTQNSTWINIVFLTTLLLTPVNYVRIWLLSDAICVTLSLLAVYYIHKNIFNTLTINQIITSGILVAIAANTQIYGVIFPLIFLFVHFVYFIKTKNYVLAKQIIYISVLSIAITIFIIYVWLNFIPHSATPDNFALLKFSSDMFWVYLNIWGYNFAPITPLLLILFYVKYELFKKDLLLISMALSIALFMILSFSYQWADNRFTFIFWYILVIAIFRTVHYIKHTDICFKTNILNITALMVFFQSFLFTTNEWNPNLKDIKIDPTQSWVARYFFAETQDRFQLSTNCGNNEIICENMIVGYDVYVKNVMKSYKAIYLNSDSNVQDEKISAKTGNLDIVEPFNGYFIKQIKEIKATEFPDSLVNGISNSAADFAAVPLGQPIELEWITPLEIRKLLIHLWDFDDRTYRFTAEIRSANKWYMLADFSQVDKSGKVAIPVPETYPTMDAVRLIGYANSNSLINPQNKILHVKELEWIK